MRVPLRAPRFLLRHVQAGWCVNLLHVVSGAKAPTERENERERGGGRARDKGSDAGGLEVSAAEPAAVHPMGAQERNVGASEMMPQVIVKSSTSVAQDSKWHKINGTTRHGRGEKPQAWGIAPRRCAPKPSNGLREGRRRAQHKPPAGASVWKALLQVRGLPTPNRHGPISHNQVLKASRNARCRSIDGDRDEKCDVCNIHGGGHCKHGKGMRLKRFTCIRNRRRSAYKMPDVLVSRACERRDIATCCNANPTLEFRCYPLVVNVGENRSTPTDPPGRNRPEHVHRRPSSTKG